MSDDKKRNRDDDRPRTGSVEPTDPVLSSWIERQWIGDETPQSIDAFQMVGRNKQDRGERVYHKDFKPNTRMDVEVAVKVSNEILGDCQDDCDSLQREQVYGIFVNDKSRGAQQVALKRIRLQPQRRIMSKGDRDRDGFDDDDDEKPRDGADLLTKRADILIEDGKWHADHNAKVAGGVMTMLFEMLKEANTENRSLRSEIRSAYKQADESASLALDRELAREDKKMWIDMKRDGFRTVRSLLPGVVESVTDGKVKMPGGKSPDAILLEGFLKDCESVPGLIEKLFGAWSEKGELQRPGIFTVNQTKIIDSVARGERQPDELDRLMTGGSDAITQEQFMQVQPLLTPGMLTALGELFARRQAASQGAQTARAAVTERAGA